MAAGATVTGPQLQADVQQFANQIDALMVRSMNWAANISRRGWPVILAGYQQLYPASDTTSAAADIAALQEFIGALQAIVGYATTATTAVATDNTAGGAAVALTVPVGGYAVVATTASDIALLRGLGDKSPAIRSVSSLNTL